MRMFQLCVCGEPLRCNEQPTPEPGPGEVRVRLRTSGVNPSDWKKSAWSSTVWFA